MLFILVSVGLLLIDQWSKWLVMKKMLIGQSIPVIDHVFYMTFVRNPGAAFSMLPYKTTFFVIITLAVIIGILVYVSRIPKEKILFKTGLALMLGGAVGNLIDRIRFGSVIDFFDFRVWPVFNVADMGICVGVGILLFEIIRTERKEKENLKKEK